MPNPSESSSPKPRLRWYQYRLRTLLIVMTLLAVWMAHISHRARQQKLAVERIQRLDGWVPVEYAHEEPYIIFPEPPPDPTISEFLRGNQPPSGPVWLRNFLGDDYFQTVVALDLGHRNIRSVNDDDLSLLLDLPDLKILKLDKCDITDDGLACVKKLKNSKSYVCVVL
jgi:hypothetical protein